MEFDPKVVERIRRVPGNDRCADCGQHDPEWASINIGVAICVRCSGGHRALGTHVSQVRSLKLDNWSEENLAKMESFGNDKVNAILEVFIPMFIPRPAELPESDSVRARFIKLKYEERAFTHLKDEEEERRKLAQREGFLMKQSKEDANKWQKRWIVLNEGALAYYASSDSQTPKGVVKLGSTAIFGLLAQNELTVSSAVGQREYHFRGATADETIDWLIALRASLCLDGRGSMVRRALGSTLESDFSEDARDERPPGSEELCREAHRVLKDGHSLKQGWLLKRSSVGVMHRWTKRYFVLIPEGVLYYFRARLSLESKWRDPMGAMSVVGASVELDDQRANAIAVRCPEGQLLLSGESEEERDEWLSAVKSAAESHLSPAN
jgi:hypothetical protein